LNYPDKHYQIVKDLLDGKFILQEQDLYRIIDKNEEFYKHFFDESFKYELIKKSKFLYLRSNDTNEQFSREIMLVLSVLVDSLNVNRKDLSDVYQDYKIADIEKIIKNSSYHKVCRNISIKSLIEKCIKRNVVKRNQNFDTFKFTNAVDIFLEEAKCIANKL